MTGQPVKTDEVPQQLQDQLHHKDGKKSHHHHGHHGGNKGHGGSGAHGKDSHNTTNNNNNSNPSSNKHHHHHGHGHGHHNRQHSQQHKQPQPQNAGSGFQIPVSRMPVAEEHHPKTREQKLMSVSVKDLLKASDLPAPVTLEPTASVEKTLHTLSEHRILSAPVVEPNRKVIGLVDVLDIMQHCLNAYAEDPDAHTPSYTHWCQDPEKVRQRAVRYALKPVRSLIGLSGANPACPVYENGDMYQLAEVFARGVRRVPVVDENDKLIQVLSQSALIKYINEHRDWLMADVGAKTLEELKLSHGPTIVSVHAKAQAIQGFFSILANKISACAVVDGHDTLVGSLSGSDLRDISLADLPDLLMPCEEFVTKRHNGTKRSPLTCSPTTTLQDCVRMLAEKKEHRVWVIDAQQHPLGVVSLTDILRIMVAPEETRKDGNAMEM